MNASQERYYEANKAKVKTKALAFYYTNKEAVKERVKKRADSRREEIRSKNKALYDKAVSTPEGREKQREIRRNAARRKPVQYGAYGKAHRAKRRVRLQGLPTENSAYAHFCELSMKLDAKCAYCGGWLIIKGATVDHILPVTRGGDNRAENLCLACKPCNSSKGNKTVEEWRK